MWKSDSQVLLLGQDLEVWLSADESETSFDEQKTIFENALQEVPRWSQNASMVCGNFTKTTVTIV